MLRLIPHLRELGHLTDAEAREMTMAIQATGDTHAERETGENRRPAHLLTRGEVAKLLGVSERTIIRMEVAGQIRSVRVGRRSVRFRPEDVEKLTIEKMPATAA
jgi:excisionase family DNA binding protein